MERPVIPGPLEAWTPEHIKALLLYSDKAVGQALLALLERQTHDEQQAKDAKYVNGRGFGAYDAAPMTGMAKEYRLHGQLSQRQLKWLRGYPTNSGVFRIGKYAKQLAEIANIKIEHAILEMEVAE